MESFGFAVVMVNAKSPFILSGVFDDGLLIFNNVIELPKSGKKEIIAELIELGIHKKAQRGMKVIVSEVSPDVSKALGLHHKTINDRHFDGTPIVNISIPRFEELISNSSVEAIEPLTTSQFIMPSSAYEIEHNINGDPYYHINWAVISDYHRSALLAVYTSVYHAVDTKAYLKQVGLLVGAEEPEDSLLQPIIDTITKYDHDVREEARKKGCDSLTGTTHKSGGRVL